MISNSRCRERREGWLGRRRNYLCRKCGQKFQHDGGRLPERARLCPDCLKDPTTLAVFHRAFFEEVNNEYANSKTL